MKIVMQTCNLEDGRSAVRITVDGDVKVECCDGEPEDNSLCRNYADIYSIPALMEMAYMDGFTQGEHSSVTNFDIEEIEVSQDEYFE